jgi:hypothetical protein
MVLHGSGVKGEMDGQPETSLTPCSLDQPAHLQLGLIMCIYTKQSSNNRTPLIYSRTPPQHVIGSLRCRSWLSINSDAEELNDEAVSPATPAVVAVLQHTISIA